MQIRTGKATSVPPLDKIDREIVQALRSNGRITNQEIAKRLSITPSTVASRLQKLDDARAMRVIAVADFSARDYDILMAVGIVVEGRAAQDVGMDFAQFPEVLSVSNMIGQCDLELLVALRDFADANQFLYEHVAKVPGVARMEMGIALDIVKFQFDLAPL